MPYLWYILHDCGVFGVIVVYKYNTKLHMLVRHLLQTVLTGQSNASRCIGQTVTEFSQPKWSGRGRRAVGRSSAGVINVDPTNRLQNSQVAVYTILFFTAVSRDVRG